jgi:large subunit ribosomal protein L17
MRHHNKNRKFGRTKNQRNALLNGLVYSLVKYKRIVTTEAKARELRPAVEKLITKSKNSDLHTKRVIQSQTGSFDIARELEAIASTMKDRQGGYTRIIKMEPRKSDGSKMAYIEFVE